MNSKKYNGISGVLKILCATFIGIIVGGIAIYYSSQDVPFMGAKDGMEIANTLILLFAISGYIGMLDRGICQVISLFRPIKTNEAVILCINILSLIFVISAGRSFTYYPLAFNSDGVLIFAYFLYVLSIILTLVDVIVLFKKIKKENIKIFSEYNCMDLLKRISVVVTPLLMIGLIFAFSAIFISNIKTIKLNEALSGGFDSFTMNDFDGNEYTEDILKGHKVIMINIWGTFCGPCIREMPELEEISEMYDEKDLKLIGMPGDLYGARGVVDEEQVAKALDIIDKTGAKYTMLIPSKEILTGVFSNLRCYPTTVFVNENGEQLKVVEGSMSKENWIEIIEEVLASEERNM